MEPGIIQLAEECLGVLQVGRVKTLGEPAVSRREEIAGFATPAPVAPEPGEAGRGAHLEKLAGLPPSHGESPAIISSQSPQDSRV